MINDRDEKLQVTYVIYSHYANHEKDFLAWEQTHSLSGLSGLALLLSNIRLLRDMLTSPGYKGLLVLFYAPGLRQSLDGMRKAPRATEKELIEENAELRFADAVRCYIRAELRKDAELASRVRFVTALDLYGIFAEVAESNLAQDLIVYLIGDITADRVRYDSPKIIEAIVRLRLLGNGIPVFRVDWDVLFKEEENTLGRRKTDRQPLGLLELFKAIAICIEAYRLRLIDPTVATFLFSASYDTRQIRDIPKDAVFEDWRGAFATRVFPALRVIPELLEKARNKRISWEQYADEAFDETLARKFYGLRPGELKCNGTSGLTAIGAHPLASVISGAFLCLSDGAILDLPPFSNFQRNVMWIDDHLKYSLHRELRHFTSVDLRLSEPSLSDAKLDDVMVAKTRPPINNLPSYVLAQYLPTLLWGTIVDAWINPDPLLKCRLNDLSKTDKERWLNLPRQVSSKALLPSHLQKAIKTGQFARADAQYLKPRLIEEGLKRIDQVRTMWSELRDEKFETFASIWAKGSVREYFSKDQFAELPEIAHGIVQNSELPSVKRDTDLNPNLIKDFDLVVNDALTYINWTLVWPRIVQIVRSIEPGTLQTDLTWHPTKLT